MPDHMSVLVHRWSTLMLVTIVMLTNIFTVNLTAVHAATVWTVTTTNDDPTGGTCSTLCSLRDALNDAANGDTIQFQSGLAGTITIGSAGPLVINKSVTLMGPGMANLAIDGANTELAFLITSGNTISISGLTVRNGSSYYNGGGVDNQGSLLTISSCTFSGNKSGTAGGGIYSTGGTLTVNNSTFSGNSAIGNGSGIYNSGGTLTVTGSSFSSNVASTGGSAIGGGIYNGYSGVSPSMVSNSTFSGNDASQGAGINNGAGTLIVRGSTFSNNSAVYSGGGIYNGSGLLTVSGSSFSSNNAGVFGGGIYNDSGLLTVSSSTFSGNNASNPYNIGSPGGGGIYTNYNGAGTATVSNSTIVGNSALANGGGIENDGALSLIGNTLSSNTANQGGGIYTPSGALTVSNSTFNLNSATTFGGGIESDGGIVSVSNSTFSGNGAVEGGGIYNGAGTLNLLSNIIAKNTATYNGPDIHYNSGTITSLGYNLIGNGTGGYVTAATGDQIGTNGAPLDPVLGILGDNGGGTQTMPIYNTGNIGGEYQKGFCGGNSGVTPAVPAITTDQRGHARKGASTGCDVGAYEVPAPPQIDSIGIYRGGTFYLRLHNTQGYADYAVAFSPSGINLPIVGDWTGNGYDTVGVFNKANGNFTLCKANVSATCANTANQIAFTLGQAGDTPLAGRWQISATHAGTGVYRPTNGVLYLKNALSTGFADNAMVMGVPGDEGVAGDWTGKGFDSPGIYRPSTIGFYLSNQVTSGTVYADINLTYGSATDLPIAGDWIAQGHDGIGMFRATNGFVYLKNGLTTGFADNAFFYGVAGDQPVAGHWQATYPPALPASILIARTAVPAPSSGIVTGDNQIGG